MAGSQILDFLSSSPVQVEAEKGKLALLRIFLAISLIPLFSFAAIDFSAANYFECALELFSGVWMLSCLLFLGRSLTIQWVSNSMATIIGLLFLYLAADGDINGSKLYFSFVYPVFTFYLQGIKNGIPWNVAFFLLLLGVLFNPAELEFVYDYPVEGNVRFLTAYSLVAVLSYFYERVRNRIQLDLEEEKDKLSRAHAVMETTNIKLQSANEESERLAKEANRANQAKSEFLANMSHELRTPLNGIVGTAHLLLQTEVTADQRKFAKIIQTSSESLLEIINDILDFSKIEAGKYSLERTNFDLHRELEKFLDSMAYKAHDKSLEIVLEIAADVPSSVFGDPGKLRQILTNLVGNGIKFTEAGEIILRVRLEESFDDHFSLCFQVIDTGIGIADENTQLLFKSFSQIDSSATRKYGGTGLGLMISKRLTEMMGGRIGVESFEGKGSKFWFTANFTRQTGVTKPQVVVPQTMAEKRVLVVEKNDASRRVLCGIVRSWGMFCEEAHEVRKGMILLKRAAQGGNPFDYALFAWQSRENVAETIAVEISAIVQATPTRFILLSPFNVIGQHRLGDTQLFSAILSKPVKKSELCRCFIELAGAETDQVSTDTPQTNEDSIVAEESPASRASLSVLLVEDNEINQFVALKLLVKLGHEVDAVANGQEAVQAMALKVYDIVLMDCQMPVMDGYEATRMIRGSKPEVLDSEVPIIAMTAHAIMGDELKCLESGMSDYLSKPVEPEKLAQVLAKWQGKKHTHKHDNLEAES